MTKSINNRVRPYAASDARLTTTPTEELSHVITTNHMGTVIAFAQDERAERPTLLFNVLDLTVDSLNDEEDWSGFQAIEFPIQVSPLGMSMINVPITSSVQPKPNTPFRVLSDGKYVIILRTSTRGTVLLNRFVLQKINDPRAKDVVTYALEPVWQVRFERSGKVDVPASDRDSTNYRSPDGVPFYEPTYELSMIDALDTGNFDVLLLSDQQNQGMRWQFFVQNQTTNQINFYNFPSNDLGLPDLSTKTLNSDNQIPPDTSLSLELDEEGTPVPLTLHQGISVTQYSKQERVTGENNESVQLKRSVRVMMAAPVHTPEDVSSVAILDLSVGIDGTLSTITTGIANGPYTQPANYAIAFDDHAKATLENTSNSLSIDGSFRVACWIYPTSLLTNNQLILSGAADEEPSSAAPWVRVNTDLSLSFGFGNGTASIECSSKDALIQRNAWQQIDVSYDNSTGTFALKFNNESVPIDAPAEPGKPTGSAIERVSALNEGFVGLIDELVIESKGVVAGKWAFDSIDYEVNPPTSPDTSDNHNTASLFGPYLTPSTAPVRTGTSGKLYIDDQGLTSYFGVLEFVETASSPTIFDGADGLIHLYFQGAGDMFDVVQYDAGAQRAIFDASWAATPVQAEGSSYESDSGLVSFISSRNGTYGNRFQIEISGTTAQGLCDITINDQVDTCETWTGVPRRLTGFVHTLNGVAVSDPSDPRIKTGEASFYDEQGLYPQCRMPVTSSGGDLFIVLTSRQPDRVPLHTFTIADADEQKCTAEINYLPPHWNSDDAQEPVLITQRWPNVPTGGQAFLDTLNGIFTRYDYEQTDTINATPYALTASFVNADEQNSSIIVFTQPSISTITLGVTGDDPNLCTVTMDISTDADVTQQATWQKVPRLQTLFSSVLEGTSSDYDYDANAEGDFSAIGALILVLTNGIDAQVNNHDPEGKPNKKANALAGASLFEIFVDGPLEERIQIIDLDAPIQAGILQRSEIQRSEGVQPLIGRSQLVSALQTTIPNNGAIAVVDNTDHFTDGTANLVVQGTNGGWIQESPRKCVAMNGDNATSISVTASSAQALAPTGDMTAEIWVKPELPTKDSAQTPRLLTFYRQGNDQLPDTDFQYMFGLENAPCAILGDKTRIHGAYNLPTADGSCTFSAWVNPSTIAAGDLLGLKTVGVTKPYLTLAVNSSGKPVLTYGAQGDSIESSQALKTNTWQRLTATLLDQPHLDEPKVTIALYLDDQLLEEKTFDRQTFQTVGAFDAGSTTSAFATRINGIEMWTRTLSMREIIQDFGRAVPHNDDGLVIQWPLIAGDGSTAHNLAAAGVELTSSIQNQPSPAWQEQGVYYNPECAYANQHLRAVDAPLLAGWRQLAMVYNTAYALQLDGLQYADCGDNASLNLNSDFAMECWFETSLTGTTQVLVSKPGAYELYLHPNGKLYLDLWTDNGLYQLKSTVNYTSGQTYYVVVTGLVTSVGPAEGSEADGQKYILTATMYINGAPAGELSSGMLDEPINFESSDTRLNLGRSSNAFGYFHGDLSETRLWNRLLNPDEIARVFSSHLAPKNQDGLISGWRFNEMQGRVAFDQNDVNNAILSSNTLWSLYRPVSSLQLYVDSILVETQRLPDPDADFYGVPQCTFGANRIDDSGGLKDGFNGQVDEVRLWSSARTNEQLSDNTYRVLTGLEPYLVGYWRFDTGSGDVIDDVTGRGNSGGLVPSGAGPTWTTSKAPLSNEAQMVYNILGGVLTSFQTQITGTPSVIEYADTQRMSDGTIFSVQKRCYAAPTANGVRLWTGYKIGDLDTVYLGQVQTKPTLIGYIEGAPPIPSENQTMPFWAGDISELLIYAEATTVEFNQNIENTVSFSSSGDSASTLSLGGGVGVFVSTSSSLSFGLGAETEWQTWALDGKLGFQANTESKTGTNREIGFGYGKPRTLSDSLTPGGVWEPQSNVLNPTIGRRFIPDNIGYALVKSLTADMYVVQLKGSGTAVKYSIVPNTSIPEDINIIDFPIDPTYIKNGTLDGKIGLENDPDYPDADLVRGSYFKPLEAYALKRQIQRQDRQLEAYFDQFNASDYNRKNGVERFEERALDTNASFDWGRRLSKRSICNTYVWTAGGGLHAEEETLVDTYTESYGANYETSTEMGLHIDLAGAFVVGVYGELDALFGTALEVTSVKNRERSESFSLTSTARPDWFLKRPILTEDPNEGYVLDGYTEDDAPGKVAGYRFMSFFLPPTQRNFNSFWQVVDQNWLKNSMTPNAVALSEASSNTNGSWRVLHRVTYVNRIPPQFQPVPDETQTPDLAYPPNLPTNAILIRLTENQLDVSGEPPSPVQIGQAVTAVLGSGPDDPGTAADVLEWWPDFLTAALNTRSPSYHILQELRVDLLNYLNQMYQAAGFEDRLSP